MEKIALSLPTIESVKTFVHIIAKFGGSYDLISGRYIVDAKSLMGILSLDLTQPLILKIPDDQNTPALREALKPFIVS
ncbi:MAG: HPr family phosphocarrier protein [Clostridiales bacterium]|nr:HPr family phosphocarrier protein [Clostridiales bacterium]